MRVGSTKWGWNHSGDREQKAHGRAIKDIYVYPLVRDVVSSYAVISRGKQILPVQKRAGWPRTTRVDGISLSRQRDGFRDRAVHRNEPATCRALPEQGAGVGRGAGASRLARPRPPPGDDGGSTSVGGFSGLPEAEGFGLRPGTLDHEIAGEACPRAL